MTVKAIRHHSVLPGRGEDDAHTQYLCLTETAQQTMNGDFRCRCWVTCLLVFFLRFGSRFLFVLLVFRDLRTFSGFLFFLRNRGRAIFRIGFRPGVLVCVLPGAGGGR